MSKVVTHYDILKVTPNASLVVIRAAHNALCKKYNPENYQDETKRAKAQAVIKRLNVAYAVLSDIEKRKLYDESIGIFEKVVEEITLASDVQLAENQATLQIQNIKDIFNQIDFEKIKSDVMQSVEKVKDKMDKVINEEINLEKAKNKLHQFIKNTKKLKVKIKNLIYENIEKIKREEATRSIKKNQKKLTESLEKLKKERNDVYKNTSITYDKFTKTTTVESPTHFMSMYNSFYLRSIKRDFIPLPVYYLIYISKGFDWSNFNAAYDSDSNPLEIKRVDSKVDTYTGSDLQRCVEFFSIQLTYDILKKNSLLGAWEIKVIGTRSSRILKIPATYIGGFLDAITQEYEG